MPSVVMAVWLSKGNFGAKSGTFAGPWANDVTRGQSASLHLVRLLRKHKHTLSSYLLVRHTLTLIC